MRRSANAAIGSAQLSEAVRRLRALNYIAVGSGPTARQIDAIIDLLKLHQVQHSKLQKKEAFFREVVNTQTEFIIRQKPDGRIIYANDPFCRHMGMSHRELRRAIEGFGEIHRADRMRWRRYLASITPNAPTGTIEFRVNTQHGIRWEEWNDVASFDRNGKLLELQSVGRDITDRKLAEKMLETQRIAIHQNEKLAVLGKLLADISHDLCNPLTIIAGYSQMLAQRIKEPAEKKRILHIESAALRCIRIVETFLAMAKSKPQDLEAVSIDEIMGNAIELVSSNITMTDIEIAHWRSSKVPIVLGDADRLHQVFTNLLVNAQQALASVRGRRKISVRVEVKGQSVRVSIGDNGPGIPPALRRRIFDPFFTTKSAAQGTGLGLSICRDFIVAHGGTIGLRATQGSGAEFSIRIPLYNGTDGLGGAVEAEGGSKQMPVVATDNVSFRKYGGGIRASRSKAKRVAALKR